MGKRYQAVRHTVKQGSEEVIDTSYNDLPWKNAGARRFYLLLLIAFLLFYPVLDPVLFGYGTNGRLAAYGDAGYYVILALGLNIVVGFAGLLDLGYVAFFAIGAYTWGIVGSSQFTALTNIPLNPQLWPWLFWPMLVITALFAAFWGLTLGVPTLRLSGDYLAIVTLGFGEIVPVACLEMDKITNGANGIIGVKSPAFPGISWSTITPLPYYYLIVALIAFSIFANIRLRDSRFGRAWLAANEDEVAAVSSGINLVNTKLFAFAAGAFFSGIAGAYHAAKLGFVSPDDFNFGDSIIYLSMVVIGGIGSIPGVIVGALVVYGFNELVLSQLDTLSSIPGNILYTVTIAIDHVAPGFSFGNIRNLIFGLVLVLLMIFRPEGLIPSTRRRSTLRILKQKEQKIQADSHDERVEMVPLDAQQNGPDVDEGLHIEKL
nr:branched-chain amino acid ABC transporter permease [Ktedonobacteraceae bacterium]